MSEEISGAMDILREAFIDDPDYAHSWHCNIAMAVYDSIDHMEHDEAHKVGNEAASRFMKLCFDVDTSAKPS